ncbi:hypothetical protein ACFLS5_04235 [Candidatus Bipolaricaulota bacterium]
MTFIWIVRSVLLFLLLPIIIPFRAFLRTFHVSAMSFALLLLAFALGALAIVLATILGVLGKLFDALIVLGIVLLLWKWPRGIRAQFHEKLRLAYRAAQNAACEQFRCSTGIDLAFCIAILAIAIVLSLSSGLLHFLVTVLVVLSVIGVIWKWPHSKYLPFLQKLRFAARALWRELRNRFR